MLEEYLTVQDGGGFRAVKCRRASKGDAVHEKQSGGVIWEDWRLGHKTDNYPGWDCIPLGSSHL